MEPLAHDDDDDGHTCNNTNATTNTGLREDLIHPQRSHSLMIQNPGKKSLASTSSANHDKHAISHDDDDEDQIDSTAQHKKTTHDKNTTKSVPFFKLFSFADKFDQFLIVSGAIAAALNGLTLPLMTILFGQLIDAFGQNASTTDQVQREVSKVLFPLHFKFLFYINLFFKFCASIILIDDHLQCIFYIYLKKLVYYVLQA